MSTSVEQTVPPKLKSSYDDWLLFAEDAQFRVERSRSRLSGTVYA